MSRSAFYYMENKRIEDDVYESGIIRKFENELKNGKIKLEKNKDKIEIIGYTYSYKEMLKMHYSAKWDSVKKVWYVEIKKALLLLLDYGYSYEEAKKIMDN